MIVSVPTIGRDEVRKHIEGGSAIVVEALPASYFTERHLPGALNLPVDDVAKLAPALAPDKDATVIVYCSDLACQNSVNVAAHLAQLGYTNVREYAEGKADWVAAGLPTESGPAAK